MTTFTADRQAKRLAEIEARRGTAWKVYSESLRDLGGQAYEDAEDRSWERLRAELQQLDEERRLVEAS